MADLVEDLGQGSGQFTVGVEGVLFEEEPDLVAGFQEPVVAAVGPVGRGEDGRRLRGVEAGDEGGHALPQARAVLGGVEVGEHEHAVGGEALRLIVGEHRPLLVRSVIVPAPRIVAPASGHGAGVVSRGMSSATKAPGSSVAAVHVSLTARSGPPISISI